MRSTGPSLVALFLMVRRAPGSALFPYTTLFRSLVLPTSPECCSQGFAFPTTPRRREPSSSTAGVRSEEHTSELQSRQYLVCRLLLEKKTTHSQRHAPSLTQ